MEWKYCRLAALCCRVGPESWCPESCWPKRPWSELGRSSMRYDDFRRSGDIDDRRDDSGGGMGGGGGGFGIPMGGGGGLGIGTIIILGLLGYAFGIDPRILIGGAEILTGGQG